MIAKRTNEQPIGAEAELELLSAWLDGELEPAQARGFPKARLR
jgi:hypothetical protein